MRKKQNIVSAKVDMETKKYTGKVNINNNAHVEATVEKPILFVILYTKIRVPTEKTEFTILSDDMPKGKRLKNSVFITA